MQKLLLIISALCTMYFVLCTNEVHAQGVIQSPNYIIQMPNLNSGAGIPTSSNYGMSATIGQTAQGLATSSGYLVKTGFQYVYSIIPFSFSISPISINFGGLTPQNPATASGTLTVSSGGAGGYQVKASENHPLKISSSAAYIPNTDCDSGCSNSTAGVWDLSTRYGFGFNMSGNDVPVDFADLTYFRPFADRSVSESPQIVMSSIYVGRGRQSTVTYKVNISGTQAGGTYNNIITFTAIPSY
jgi:hypothetical protein